MLHPKDTATVSSTVLAHASETGIYNFCNPGAISHNQVLELYRDRFYDVSTVVLIVAKLCGRGKGMSPAQGYGK